MNRRDRLTIITAALRSALRRHAEVNAGRLPDLDAAVRIALEIADERPDIGEWLDMLYPTAGGVRRFAARCLADLAPVHADDVRHRCHPSDGCAPSNLGRAQ